MPTSQSEVRFDLCDRHRLLNWNEQWPGYTFASHIFFPPRSCKVPDCEEQAYYTLVGLPVPSGPGELANRKEERWCKGTVEIFGEARELLDGGSAIERLSYFLRTRIVPSGVRDFLAKKLIRQFANMLLIKLNIDPECSISDRDKHRILMELDLYPQDQEI